MSEIMIFWLALAVVALVIEMATVNLVSIWFVAGAVAAFVAALFGAALSVQIGIFVLVTAILLIFTMPAARRLLQNSKQATNSDRIIGQEAVVTEEIDNIKGTGQVKVLGNIWSATSFDNTVIPKGSKVTVDSISGVKAVVKIDKE
ncbi:MAG: NfeD family protein [Clostridia bacterium]|nr:NfeD family protein [Clostridia bacterium]